MAFCPEHPKWDQNPKFTPLSESMSILSSFIRLQNSRFRKAGSAVSVILECEALEPHTPCGRVRRENDCRLSIQRFRSKEGLYNVTEVTEIAWQVHPHLKFDTLDAFFSREICCVSVQWWFRKDECFCFSVKCRTCPFLKRLKSVKWIKQHRKNRLHVEEESQTKRQRRTIADCVFVVLKHSLPEILNWMDNNRKHFYCAAEKGKNVANAG